MSSHPKVDSKHALLLAAKKVFGEKSYDGATVKDLADEAGVNVSLVSYHFGGKDGLYRACLMEFANERIDAIERILKAPSSTDELRVRLRLFADEIVDVHLREPDLCRIIHRDVERLAEIGEEVFRKGFYQLFLKFVEFLKASEKARVIRKFKNHEQLATLVFGALFHMVKTDDHRKLIGRPTISDPKYREEVLTLWTDLTIAALGQPSSGTQEHT